MSHDSIVALDTRPSLDVVDDANTNLRKKIMEVQKDTKLSPKEKQQKIFYLFNEPDQQVNNTINNCTHCSTSTTIVTSSLGTTVGMVCTPCSTLGSKTTVKSLLTSIATTGTLVQIPCAQLHANEQNPGCIHYDRKCSIYAECCRKFFPCHKCHDLNNDHVIASKDIKVIRCRGCSQIQPESNKCTNPVCQTVFGGYYCNICKLWATGVDIYHCSKCEVCLIGRQDIDFKHCDTCGYCMSVSRINDHICYKCDDEICAICKDDFQKSLGEVERTKCGHLFHMSCMREYVNHDIICPICRKTLFDMHEYWLELDQLKAFEIIPDDFQSWRIQYQCNDCMAHSWDRFSIYGNKCSQCNSYNTTQELRQMVSDEDDETATESS